MTDKNFDKNAPDEGRGDDEVRPNEEGSEAQASGPAAQEPELTVDDILAADQNVDAAAEDAHLADHESALLGDLKRLQACLLYTSPSPRDRTRSRMPSSA